MREVKKFMPWLWISPKSHTVVCLSVPSFFDGKPCGEDKGLGSMCQKGAELFL